MNPFEELIVLSGFAVERVGWGDVHSIIDIVIKIQGDIEVGGLHLGIALGMTKKEMMSEVQRMKRKCLTINLLREQDRGLCNKYWSFKSG